MAALPVFAQSVTFEQLQQTISTQKAARTSDGAMARALSSLELTERLSSTALAHINAEFKPGRKTELALELLSSSSAFLDLPAAEIVERPPPDDAAEQTMISAANSFVTTTLRHMPDFIATRTTLVFDDSATAISLRSSELRLMGSESREITYRDGLETALGGTNRTFKSSPEESQPGLSSKGEFGPILTTILGDASYGSINWSHWENSDVGVVAVFHYKIPYGASHYRVDFCCKDPEYPNVPGGSYHGMPAYSGSISIDPATGAILRVTLEADLDPTGPVKRSAIAVDYGKVEIGGRDYICPVHSVAISSSQSYLVKFKRDTTILRINDVIFANYHRFGSSMRVVSSSQGQ
jgi:hypothetical protein